MKLRTAKKIIAMDRRGAYVTKARFWKAAWIFGRWHARREKRPYGSRPLHMLAAQRKFFESMVFAEVATDGQYEGLFSKSSLAGLRHRSITAPMSTGDVKFDFAAMREALDKIAIPMTPISAVMLPSILEALKKKCEPGDVAKFDLVGINIHTRDTDAACRALAIELRLQGHKVYLFTTEDSAELGAFPPMDYELTMGDAIEAIVAEPELPSMREYIDGMNSQIMRSLAVPAHILNSGSYGSFAYRPIPAESDG